MAFFSLIWSGNKWKGKWVLINLCWFLRFSISLMPERKKKYIYTYLKAKFNLQTLPKTTNGKKSMKFWENNFASISQWKIIFCFQKFSDLQWETMFKESRKSFEIRGWRQRIFKKIEITKTNCSNSERSEQFLVTECFLFKLFLDS